MKNKFLMLLIFMLPAVFSAGNSHAEMGNKVWGDNSWYLSAVYASDIKDIGWGLKSDGFRKRDYNGGIELGSAYKYRDYTEFLLSMAVLNWKYELKEGDVYEYEGVKIKVSGNPTLTIWKIPVVASVREYIPIVGGAYLFGQLGVGGAFQQNHAYNPVNDADFKTTSLRPEVVPGAGIIYQLTHYYGPVIALGLEAKYHFTSVDTSDRNYYTLQGSVKVDY